MTETNWDSILNKLGPSGNSPPLSLAPYYQLSIPFPAAPNETLMVTKQLLLISREFIVHRYMNYHTLKLIDIQNLQRTILMKEHLYQISDVNEFQERFASSDVSGQVYVWTIKNDSINILMRGKFEDKLCQPLQIQWKHYQQFCTYNVNEISLWSFNEACLNPQHFQTLVQESSRILQIKFSQINPSMYAVTSNSIIMLNTIYLTKIREFKPSKKEKLSQIFIVKNINQKQRDIIVTISNKGLIKVWDLSLWNEEKKKFIVKQKIHIPSQVLSYKKTVREEISSWAQLDDDQRFLFVLSKNETYILQVLHIDPSFNFIQNEQQINQQNLFIRQNRFQIPGQGISKIYLSQILVINQDIYFQQEKIEIKKSDNLLNSEKEIFDVKDLVYILYTMNQNFLNINFIQGDELIFQDEDEQKEIMDIQQLEEQLNLEQQTQIQEAQKFSPLKVQNIQTPQNENKNNQQIKNQKYYKENQNKDQIVNEEQNTQNQSIQILKDNIQKSTFIEDLQDQNLEIINSEEIKDSKKRNTKYQKKIKISQEKKLNDKSDIDQQQEIEKIEILNQEEISNIFTNKIEQIFKQENFSQIIDKQIQNQINESLKKSFQENFNNQVTPAFEKYLENMFVQIMSTLDQGQNYYRDKTILEKQKSNQIKESIDDNIKSFSKINQLIHQVSDQSFQHFQQIEQKVQEKEKGINYLMDSLANLQKNQNDMCKKIQELEKIALKNSKNNIQDDEQDFIHNQNLQNLLEKKSQESNFYIQKQNKLLFQKNFQFKDNYNQIPMQFQAYNQQNFSSRIKRPEDIALQNVMSALENYQKLSSQTDNRGTQSYFDYSRNYFPYDQNKN